jgi:hypothetical protein
MREMCSVRIDRKMMLSSNLRKYVFSVRDKKVVQSGSMESGCYVGAFGSKL